MKFKSPIFTQTSGSIGGTTFSHNKGGMYTRSRTIPTNPQTALQTERRAALGFATQDWANFMTPAERESWEVYAANVPVTNKLGDSINLSGQQMYIRTAVFETLNPANPNFPFFTAPALFNTGELGDFEITEASIAADLELTFNSPDWDVNAAGWLYVFVGLPQGPSKTFFNGPYRYAFGAIGANTQAYATTFTALPYTYVAGQYINVRARVVYDDGRLTQWLKKRILVTA